ncbi:hypothetical protein RJ640_021899, partial [Escallonia rubra]
CMLSIFVFFLQVYIVYMGNQPNDGTSLSSLHLSMLLKVVGSDAPKCLLHSYKRSFNGFVANLSEEEMLKLAEMEGIVSVFPSEEHKLHTTRSWDFIGLPLQVKRSSMESDVIVGVIDTGIWPESESFKDDGFGPPPKKWKGICQASLNFTCNNKLIGARYYGIGGKSGPKDFQSPRDYNGHGTHTASTAAGNVVYSASLMGLGQGTARGGVPSARISVYKSCFANTGCNSQDILAAFDDAVADGVDIISVSAGPQFGREYFTDVFSIGAFHAMKAGILTSQSGGNEGPNPETISSVSPWTLSVAASTIDRRFFTAVQLGDSTVYTGISVNTFQLNHSYPLIDASDAPNTLLGVNGSISRYCLNNTLDKNLVKGKIVLCDASLGTSLGQEELLAGAAGSVTQNMVFKDIALSFALPATAISSDQGHNISDYIRSARNATAVIMKSTEGKDALAPYIVLFSSRGPNPIARNILKPDLSAPGVEILAAWSPANSVSEVPQDNRAVPYNIISGTSMACPHATGVAAYIKTFHPTWSPAAIKSALMTSASPMSAKTNPDAEFAYGAGHINPMKAVDPGLVYDAYELDYVKFLCDEGYDATIITLITGDNSNCSEFTKGFKKDLNYPSIALSVLRNEPIQHTFYRTVTNVGSAVCTYKAVVTSPPGSGIQVLVVPSVLNFTALGQKLSFAVAIVGSIGSQEDPIKSTSLVWDDGVHRVRSPIVVYAPS